MKKRTIVIGSILLVVAVCALALKSRVPAIPALRRYQHEIARGFPVVDGSPARERYFIRVPFAKLKREIENYQYGSGSSNGSAGFYGWGNYDTEEAFAIYEGRIDLFDYPYMGNPVREPGSSPEWSTLVYRRPQRSIGLFETIRRMF